MEINEKEWRELNEKVKLLDKRLTQFMAFMEGHLDYIYDSISKINSRIDNLRNRIEDHHH